MGARGPAPTPTETLELRGSTRAGRHAPSQPRPPIELAPPPDWLSDDAKAMYAELGGHLASVGLVTVLDTAALASFAMAWADLRKVQTFLDRHGLVYVARAPARPGEKEGTALGLRAYPQARLAADLRAELMRLGDRLGLSPAARSRLVGTPPRPVAAGNKPRPWLVLPGKATG